MIIEVYLLDAFHDLLMVLRMDNKITQLFFFLVFAFLFYLPHPFFVFNPLFGAAGFFLKGLSLLYILLAIITGHLLIFFLGKQFRKCKVHWFFVSAYEEELIST